MRLHFAVLPPQNISKMAGNLAAKYAAKFPHWFVVDNRRLFPHITLFSLEVDPKKSKELEKVAVKALNGQKALRLSISRHSYYHGHGGGWTGLKIRDAKSLRRLRSRLLEALKRADRSARVKGDAFSPHMTLTKFKDDSHSLVATRNSMIPIKEFMADTVAICHDDDQGYMQVTKILKKFKLKSNRFSSPAW